jgi:transposase
MRRMRDRVAGIDVHRDTAVVCCQVWFDDRVVVEKQTFSTTASGLRSMREWLAEVDVELVVMEATGDYWKPVYYPLEGEFDEVWVVNAQHVKNVPGRKTDMADAEWLADVAAHGMVRPSFIPPPEIRALRDLARYRKTQVKARGQEIQRLEKVLQDAGVKLTSVASRVWSKSSRAMIEALISGERDPRNLAELAKGRMRPKIPDLIDALEGSWRPHHSVVAGRILAHIDFLDSQIEDLNTEIVQLIRPFRPAVELLATIPGVSNLTAETIIAEIGTDMSRFPTPGHLAAWAGLAPGSRESAGKRKPVGTRPGGRHLRSALIESAKSASRTKDTFLATRYQRVARRRGHQRATVAVAHTILCTAWHMLTTGEVYHELGHTFHDRYDQPERRHQRAITALEAAGYTITKPQAA